MFAGNGGLSVFRRCFRRYSLWANGNEHLASAGTLKKGIDLLKCVTFVG